MKNGPLIFRVSIAWLVVLGVGCAIVLVTLI